MSSILQLVVVLTFRGVYPNLVKVKPSLLSLTCCDLHGGGINRDNGSAPNSVETDRQHLPEHLRTADGTSIAVWNPSMPVSSIPHRHRIDDNTQAQIK